MSFESEYLKLRSERQNNNTSGGSKSVPRSSSKSSSFEETYLNLRRKRKKKEEEEDIAPFSVGSFSSYPLRKTSEEEENERKWYQKGHFEDGYDFGDITKTILGVTEDSASLKDLTWNSLKRGYYNARYGEESFAAMNGSQNDKEVFEKILAGDEYQFTPGNDVAGAVSGAFELLGQQARQFTNPRTLAFTGSAAAAAAIAGQAGPQVLLPEEIITVPAAASAALF